MHLASLDDSTLDEYVANTLQSDRKLGSIYATCMLYPSYY